MINKYTFGEPYPTEAVVQPVSASGLEGFPFACCLSDGLELTIAMDRDDIVFGLGESIRGINKRGWVYESWCSDDPYHTEDKISLYAAHNFILISGRTQTGIFIDFPGRIRWDIGYTKTDELKITVSGTDADVYVITGESPRDVVREFRGLIGPSYVPPFWAFGFQQSRWSYPDAETVDRIIAGYDAAQIPLDCVYLDIDYMKDYKDFTVDERKFPDFADYAAEKKKQGIRLIPIIDAGIREEDGYSVYEEGKRLGYFCKNADGSDFEAGVWPGMCCFPDFLRADVREWFGSRYRALTDAGIEGFWNDMNEPALFYSADGLRRTLDLASQLKGQNLDLGKFFGLKDAFAGLSNSERDYASIFHHVNGRQVGHMQVHNIYGANMTRAAGDFFEKEFGREKILMLSRASYIGAHRSGGIWFGDNHSWWSHILLALKMLPGANMCGFLYCGPDLGGFNGNVSRDLLLRFLALGVFTPLMRCHSALGTRDQECFAFEDPGDFRDVVQVRYRLIPYLWDTFRKAAQNGDMIFRPLAFDYPDDMIACECETQLMLGEECMIAPVFEQNASGRTVYLPEDMTLAILSGESVRTEPLEKGFHYVRVALNEVPLLIKKGKKIPLCRPALRTALLDTEKPEYIM
ncbi:MAG: alpha-glucosidase [Lachnospiraceae bacterium]|nr:alpha-glucosidase [Lachnospiraceae bacterium]